MDSDEALAHAAQQGDATAYSRLVDRYQQRLLRFLLLHCISRADAEDALQETFLSAWRYLSSFDARWRFSTWLYRIAIRQAGRLRRPATAAEVDTADPDADPLTACIAASDRDNLWIVARRELAADAVTALWLYYVDDMPQAEIARVMRRSLAWTKVSLMRSRRRLKLALAGSGGDDVTGGAYE